MSRINEVNICEILRSRQEAKSANKPDFDLDVDYSTEIEPVDVPSEMEVSVNFSNVAAIDIPVINDEHGRLSDIIEALETELDLSVIPLEMAEIAPEVRNLARHKIFELGGERFAMSHRKRDHVIKSYKERILKSLTEGIPFEETLNIKVSRNGVDYNTISLSEDEWTLLLSMFRHYKQKLKVSSGNLILKIIPERM